MPEPVSLTELAARLEAAERRLAAHDLALDFIAGAVRDMWPRHPFPRSFAEAANEGIATGPMTDDVEVVKLARRLLVSRLTTSDPRPG